MCPLGDGLQEGEGVVVVDNVGGAELEDVGLAGVLGLGGLLVNLGVFNNVGLAVLGEDQTDGLGSIALADNLGGDVDLLVGGEADEGWVGDLDEAVVYAVGVDVLDTSLAHVINDTREDEGVVDTTVAVGGHGNLALGLEKDLSVVGDAREDTLLEEDDILLSKAKVLVLLKEALSRSASRTAGHDVPRNDGVGTSLLGLRGEGLNLADALGLDLEKGLLGGQANVEAALGGRATETSALATSHQNDSDLALADEVEAGGIPAVEVLWCGVKDTGAGRVGERLEGIGGTVRLLGRAESALGDLVDVCGVEAGELVVQSGLVRVGEGVVEGQDVLLAGIGVLLPESVEVRV